MATIDELLGKSAAEMTAMNDEQLAIYLDEITKIEPKPLPKALESTEDEEPEEKDDCPIKPRKKKASKAKKEKPDVKDLFKEIDDL